MISKILGYIKQRGIGQAMLISYIKIPKKPNIRAGYVDIDEVVSRYKKSAQNLKKEDLQNQAPVVDSNYFIKKYFSDRKLNKGKLLDVGCGNGLYSVVFSSKDHPFSKLQYYGSEIDEKIISLCKSINPGRIFIESFADKINIKDNYFKVVHCSSTLHYTLSKWKESIKEMTRVSNEYLIFTRLPVSKYNENFYVHQTVKTFSQTENHYFIVINRDKLEEEFIKNGMQIVFRDYSQEEYKISGVDEKIILVQYILKKVV